MARPVDEKIVRMKLDNTDFQRKAGETVGVFGKLTTALNKIPGVNLGKTSGELGAIGDAAGKIPADKLATDVDTIAKKFSLLGIAGVAAIASISSKLTEMATDLAKSFTGIQGMTDGFKEYETKIGSIQTILTNTAKHGTTLKDVNSQLENLNEYSDKTIYNFADMTRNIGLFTTSGLELDTSVTAIKGLSNWAAASGASASNASNAMYQLSQSLSSGVVRLQDWKSVENSNMGGAIFRDALLDTAKNMGKVVDMSEGFNYSLEQNWLTTDVLMSVLDDFSKREDFIEAATKVRTFTQMIDTSKEAIGSGWAKTWELIFGDFEQATVLWSGINDVLGGFINKSADARNAMVKGFVDAGGLRAIGKVFSNVFGNIGAILKSVSSAFREVFPKKESYQIALAIKQFSFLTDKLKLTDGAIANVRDLFVDFFEIIKKGLDFVKELGTDLVSIIPNDLGDRVKASAGEFGDFAGNIMDAAATSSSFSEFAGKIGGSFDDIYRTMKPTIDLIEEFVGSKLSKFVTAVKDFKMPVFKNPLGKEKDMISGTLSETATQLSSFDDTMTNLGDKLRKFWGSVKEFMVGIGLEEVLAGGFLAGAIVLVKKLGDMFKSLGESPAKFLKVFEELAGGLGDTLKAFQQKAKYDSLIKIAGSLAILAISLKLMETISIEDIGKGLGALAASLTGMMIAIKVMEKTDLTGFGGGKLASAMIGMGISIAIIAGALKKISALEPEQLKAGIFAIGAIMGMLAISLKVLNDATSKTPQVANNSGAILLQMVGLGLIISLVANAIKRLGKIDGPKLAAGTAAVSAILVLLVGAFVVLGKAKLPSLTDMKAFTTFSKGLATSAAAIAIFTFSITLLVSAVEKIGGIDTSKLTQGLVGLGILLAEIAIFQKIAGDKGSVGAGIGLAIMAASIGLLVAPLALLGAMDPTDLGQGLTTIGIALLTIAGALKLAEDGLGGAVGIAVVIGSLTLLYPIVKLFGDMDLVTLAQGLVGMSVALLAISLAMMAAQNSVVGAAALVIAAGALNLMVVPIAALAILPLEGVIVALVAMAGTFLIFGAASLLLQTAVPFMVALAGAIALLGGAVLLGGAGLFLFGLGLTTLSAISIVAIAGMLAAFGVFLEGIAGLMPKVGMVISAFVNTIIDIIIAVMPKIGELGLALILSLLTGIITGMPLIMQGVVLAMLAMIEGMTAALDEYGPRLITATLQLVGELVSIIVEALIAIIDLFLGWIPGVSKNLTKASAEASEAIKDGFDGETLGVDMAKETEKGIFKYTPKVKEATDKMGGEAIKGYTGAIDSGQGEVALSTQKVVDTTEKTLETTDGSKGAANGLDTFMDTIGTMLPGVDLAAMGVKDTFETTVETTDGSQGAKNATKTWTDSMGNEIPYVQSAAKEVVTATETEFKSVNNKEAGEDATKTYNEGIKSKKDDTIAAAVEIGTAAKNSVGSVSASNEGANFALGFAGGIQSKIDRVRQQALNMANAARDSVNTTLEMRSPSRVMTKAGQFAGDGFVRGIANRVKTAGQVASEMASNALESVNGFVDSFANAFQADDQGMEFKLIPIVDLSELDKIPNKTFGMNTDTSGLSSRVSSLNGRFGQNGNRLNEESISNTTGDTVNITYEIDITANGDLPQSTIKRMANQIQTEIKNASDRDKMSRGEVVYY